MINATKLFCFFVASIPVIAFHGVDAFAAAGTEAASFLEIPVGAGPAALGSAYTALATDAYAPVWNPAGLSNVNTLQVATQYLSYLESINDEFASVAYPLADGKAIGVSAQYLGSGDITGTAVGGAPTGTFSSEYGAYTLAYGQRVGDRLSLGLAAKWIHAQISDVSASALGVDFGSTYEINRTLTAAATVSNVGTSLKFLNESDPLPLAFHAALAYQPTTHWLGATEVVVPRAGSSSIRFGGQWRPIDAVALRVGYRTDTLKELSALAGFSAGIGFSVWKQELAYAWVPLGDLGNTNYISLVLRFGEGPTGPTTLHPSSEPAPAPPPTEDAPPPLFNERDHSRPAPSLDRGAPEGAGH